MSADNYYRVCKHPKGGFTAVMGFMSNTERPEPRDDSPQFDTWRQAYAYADRDAIIEYGIQVDPDCASTDEAVQVVSRVLRGNQPLAEAIIRALEDADCI